MDSVIVRATVSLDGILLSADDPLLALQVEAGGQLDGKLLIPQLAALAMLAQRLKIPLSRPVLAACGDVDVDMWVKAQPGEAVIDLSILDWRERPARGVHSEVIGTGSYDSHLPDGSWSWQMDTQMRFVTADGRDGREEADLPAPGTRLTAHFRLLAGTDGAMPILEAIAGHRHFAGQRAAPVNRPGEEVILSGTPIFDVAGRLTGYRGVALVDDMDDTMPSQVSTVENNRLPVSYTALFGKRLDRALRQPLGRIIANADTISGQLEGALREDYAAYAADIGTAGRHLMELVDDLADLQAIDRPDFAVAKESIDMADIARRTAGLLAVKAADRHIKIDAPRIDEVLPVVGEFRRALQVMVNLVGNALRYSPEGSMIWIRLEREAGIARVVIADQGRGIAQDDQERIFEKFERLGRDEAGGSGLGLYISRQLARAMGGDIKVESAPGQGARFLFTLPAEE
jgi:signal transduction histidine kinase